MNRYIMIFTLIFAGFLNACGGGGAAVDELLDIDPEVVEVPEDLQITITNPSADNKKVGYLGILSGSCNSPGKSVQIRGSATGFSVCQADSTWEAEVDFSSAAIGPVAVTAYLVDDDDESAGVSRTFLKDNTDCDLEANRTAQYAGGDGSVGDPYKICTASQLNNVRINLSSNYIMKNDVDMNSSPFTPIPANFSGVFDGNQFTIKDLYIYDLSGSDVALFKRSVGATFQNIVLENFNVTGPSVVSGLVARATSGTTTISNVIADGKSTASSHWVGGLVGYVENGATLSVSNVIVDSTLSGQSRVGAVLGGTHASAAGVTISDADVSGSATGADNYVGGVVGLLDTTVASLSDVTSAVAVAANGGGGTQDSYVGGVVGRMDGGDILTCSSSGAVTGTGSYVGGVVGQFGGDKIYNCDVTSAVAVDTSNRAAAYIGGILGQANSGSTADIYQSTVDVDITVVGANVAQQVGGIAGFFRGVRIQEVYADGDSLLGTKGQISVNTGDGATNGGYYVGGAVGYLQSYVGDSVLIQASYANVDIDNATAATNSQTGGYVGYIAQQDGASASDITINGVYASGDVTSNNRYVGGFAGNMYSARADSTFTLTNVNASGSVSVSEVNTVSIQYVGGFAGSATTRDAGDATNAPGGYQMTNVRATGSVTVEAPTVGGERVGGLIGYLHTGRSSAGGSTTNLSRVYATGDVTVNTAGTFNYVGGLIGYLNASTNSTINLTSAAGQSYALGDVMASGANYVGGGFGYITTTTNGTVNINDFYSNGNVSGMGNVGGLAGRVYANAGGATFALNDVQSHDSNSTTPAPTVVGTAAQVGGLIGLAGLSSSTNFLLSNCSSVSPVTGSGGYTGGLVGYDHDNANITNCTASGAVAGTPPYVGGLTGGSDRSGRNFTNVMASGNVTVTFDTAVSQGFIGGLSGRLAGSSSISEGRATGNVVVNVDAPGTLNEAYVGGLVGYMQGTVDQSYAIGNVTVTNSGSGNQQYVGGLLGRGNDLVTNSFATGDVQGGYYVGGLIGYHRNGLQNAFAAGNVGGVLQVGGLIGNYDGGAATVTKVYALGSVTRVSGTQTNRFGQLIGYCNGGVTDAKVQNGYYNLTNSTVDANISSPETNCNSSTANETRGITDASMLTPGTGFASFDFVSTNVSDWRYPVNFRKKGSATVYPYPVLYWLEN